MNGMSILLTRRSSARFSFVSAAERTIHHAATDFHQAAADLQGGKVLASEGMKPEHCHHQSVTHLGCLGEFGHGLRAFGFLDEGQAGFDEPFWQDQAIEFGACLRHQGEVLGQLGKPVQFEAWNHVSGRAPQAAYRDVDRRGAHASFRLSDVDVDVFGRHVSRSWCLSSEQPIAIEASKKIPVMSLVDLARDRLEMAGSPSACEPRSRTASHTPGFTIGFRPGLKGQRPYLFVTWRIGLRRTHLG